MTIAGALRGTLVCGAVCAAGCAGALAQPVPTQRPEPAHAAPLEREAPPSRASGQPKKPGPRSEAAGSGSGALEAGGATPASQPEHDPVAPADVPVPVPAPAPDTRAKASPQPDPVQPATAPPAGSKDASTVKPTPQDLRAAVPEIDPETATLAAAAVEAAKACEAELTSRGVRFTVGESVSEGRCGVLRPITVETLSSGVTVGSKTQILCQTALALDHWVTEAVIPAAREGFNGAGVKTVDVGSSYVCRARSSETKISEHARGSALDIGDFTLSDGHRVSVQFQAEGSPEQTFQRRVRDAACGPFKTVLGPGTDSDHTTHLHLDMAARRNGATYCK